jgi:hypothetical protein
MACFTSGSKCAEKMKAIAIPLMLLGCVSIASGARVVESDDCKQCREDRRACVKAHSQDACKMNYDICMKHCRRK